MSNNNGISNRIRIGQYNIVSTVGTGSFGKVKRKKRNKNKKKFIHKINKQFIS